MLKIATPLLRTVALAALIGSTAFAVPLYAAPMDSAGPAPGATPSAMDQATPDQTAPDQTAPEQENNTAPSAQTHASHMNKHDAASVEQRITTLHDKLKITDAQEADWTKVAQTMRDNEANIAQLVQERHQDPDSKTAVDDLESYQKIAQAHADGLQKLSSAFETLYNEMSDDQKKNADEVFGRFEGHRGGKAKKHS